MIPTKKLTPLAFGYRITSRRPPARELAVILRGKYRLGVDGSLELVRASLDKLEGVDEAARRELDQAAILVGQGSLTADVFAEDDQDRAGEVLYPSDFAEWKPRADVMLRGTCHAPKGATTTHVAFSVGAHQKQLSVLGPRVWVDRIAGGKASEPLEIGRVPLDWAHAWGGPSDGANPVGVGKESRELPQVEDPRRPGEPASFAPLNPDWSLRRGKTGKEYGDAWEKTRAPWCAVDYDWSAQNAAPEDQQIEGYLRGDEELRFVNLHAEASTLVSALPGIRPRAFVMHVGGRIAEVALVLDTVFVDMDKMLVHVGWRGLTPVREDDLSDVAHLYLVDEPLAEAPRPKEEHEAALRAFADDPYGLKSNPATELQALEEKLESGELEKELAALPPEKDPFTALFGPLLAKVPGVDASMAQVRDVFAKTLGTSPEARSASNQYLIQTLRSAFDGPSGPRTVIASDGKVEGKPMLARTMRDIVKQQNAAAAGGAAPPNAIADATRALKESVANAETPGLDADDVRIPTALEPPEPEPGADFSGFDLDLRDLAGRDLTGCKFDGALLRGVSFRGATLAGATFRGATLVRCDFTEADLRGADFTQAHVTRARLVGARLDGAELGQANLVRCDASGARLDGARAAMMQIDKTKLVGASFEGAAFEKCAILDSDAERARFSTAKLGKSFFRQTSLAKARFDEADVSSGGFFGCNLTAASFFAARGHATNFQGSRLTEADMRHADMPSSLFMDVPAEGADLFAANLRRARLYRAGLRGARLDKADLLQADVRKAVLTETSLRGANCYQAVFVEAHGNDAEFAGANLEGANFQRSTLTRKS